MKDLFSGSRLIGIYLARPLYSHYIPTIFRLHSWGSLFGVLITVHLCYGTQAMCEKRIYGTRQDLIWSHG